MTDAGFADTRVLVSALIRSLIYTALSCHVKSQNVAESAANRYISAGRRLEPSMAHHSTPNL